MKRIFYLLIFISFNVKSQTNNCQNFKIESELNNVIDLIVPNILIKEVNIVLNKTQNTIQQTNSTGYKCDSLLKSIISKNNLQTINTFYRTDDLDYSQVKLKLNKNITINNPNSIYINKIVKHDCVLYFHLFTHLQNHYNELIISSNLNTHVLNILCEYAEMP